MISESTMTKAGLGGEEEESIILVVVENGVISLSVGLVDDREGGGRGIVRGKGRNNDHRKVAHGTNSTGGIDGLAAADSDDEVDSLLLLNDFTDGVNANLAALSIEGEELAVDFVLSEGGFHGLLESANTSLRGDNNDGSLFIEGADTNDVFADALQDTGSLDVLVGGNEETRILNFASEVVFHVVGLHDVGHLVSGFDKGMQ